MAEPNSGGGGSSPINLNSLLALLTLAGGIWLVSHRLTSDRPVTPASGPQEFVGEQKVEARLWEDPFKAGDEDGGATNDPSETSIDRFTRQIGRRIDFTNRVLLLPVMLPSGQYAEDQETRIRSRFAIVSALGTSGYAPEDAEHVGRLTILWPTRYEVKKAELSSNAFLEKLWNTDTNRLEQQLGLTNISSSRMELRYEWYQPREFFPRPCTNGIQTNVLVLWVNDTYFEDEPLLRLPLLLETLTDPDRLVRTNYTNRWQIVRTNIPAVALIGPRRSSTLRAMLATLPARTNACGLSNLWGRASMTLSNISVYCATPSAMDEVLVTKPHQIPRESVRDTLVSTNGFKSFFNFAATDAQLAREVLAELALGGIDLKEKNNHVVLISESDTFYAQVLSLTYGAELAKLQENPTIWTNTYDFVEAYKGGKALMPTNLHSFVYLRGLDGQTVNREAGADGGGGNDEHATKPSLTSFEELRSWTPDANKPEGRAQFDYLSRLGGQLTDLQKQLQREDRGRIEAIGIIGSDVYDTLLILQALRPQFPDVKFFTTDLDARFLSPREREWTRDLILVSGYGLTLHPELQMEIPPFRDSAQTAEFAATLAALGNTNLLRLAFVPPRRFEIGIRSVVDLSVSNALFPIIGTDNTKGPWLHPLTRSEIYKKDHKKMLEHFWRDVGLVLAIFLILALVCWCWKSVRELAMDRFWFPRPKLSYDEEDIGGPDGAEALLRELRVSHLPIFTWMKDKLPGQFQKPFLTSSKTSQNQNVQPMAPGLLGAVGDDFLQSSTENSSEKKQDADNQKIEREKERHLKDQAEVFVALLNRMLKHEAKHFPRKAEEAANRLRPYFVSEWKRTSPRILSVICWWAMGRMRESYCARRFIDTLLKKLATMKLSGSSREEFETSALLAANAARVSTWKIFRLRCERLVCFWVGVVILSVSSLALGRRIWYDTFGYSEGEPFSLTNGASEWPAEILRLLVCAAAIGCSYRLYRQMREAFFELTRKYRLSFQSSAKPEPATGVCILKLWDQHRKRGELSQRLVHIFVPLIFYTILCALVFLLFQQDPFDDVRGDSARWWNRWLICGSGILFVALTFLTMDSALMCREFIHALNKGTTAYPEAVRRHFARQRGDINKDFLNYLNDWIDLQLIVDLTERVGKLVYYPAVLLFVLLLARNGWWDALMWSAPLILMFTFNLLLALASVAILQRAAREAKSRAEDNLATKVKLLEASTAPSVEQNNANQAKQLLEEIRNLRRGAFAPFWENPVVGALVLSSGGTTALQMLIWFMNR